MLNGAILLWFILSALAVAFVIVDIRTTPESPVLKWGFVLLTAGARLGAGAPIAAVRDQNSTCGAFTQYRA